MEGKGREGNKGRSGAVEKGGRWVPISVSRLPATPPQNVKPAALVLSSQPEMAVIMASYSITHVGPK